MFELENFPSFEQYAAALGHSQLRITTLGRQQLPWAMRSFTLDSIALRIARDGGPCHVEAAVDAEGIGLLACCDAPGKVTGNGVRLEADNLMIIPGRTEIESTSFDSVIWCSAFMPLTRMMIPFVEEPGRVPCGVVGQESGNCSQVRSILLRVVNAAVQGAFESNEFGRQDAAQEMIAATRALLSSSPLTRTREPANWRAVPRHEIILRVRQMFEQRDGEPLTLGDLATAAGVSARTLHNVFHEHFGVSPKRYLRLRLLNLARGALCRADSEYTRVTDVAARLGVWEWGRFARDYRALFGELPSHTLRGVSRTV
jgi:AraC family ethanolamine operon transcriptional activator